MIEELINFFEKAEIEDIKNKLIEFGVDFQCKFAQRYDKLNSVNISNKEFKDIIKQCICCNRNDICNLYNDYMNTLSFKRKYNLMNIRITLIRDAVPKDKIYLYDEFIKLSNKIIEENIDYINYQIEKCILNGEKFNNDELRLILRKSPIKYYKNKSFIKINKELKIPLIKIIKNIKLEKGNIKWKIKKL